ncbi:MAG TPA: MMPL family transporter, partial [Nocardioides sp.]|nr:MMPL family transporter [Nocardioides sp.]
MSPDLHHPIHRPIHGPTHRPGLVARVPLRAARWSATHPWRAIGAWFAFVAIAVALAALIPTKQTTDADYRIGDSGRADAMITAGHLDPGPVENVLVTVPGGASLDGAQAREVARELAHDVAGARGVTGVDPPVFNHDRTAMLVNIQLAPKTEDAAPVQAVTDRVAAAHPDLTIREAGEDSINTAINDRVGEDLHSAEGISLPITLLLMLLAFGALIAAGVPVLLAITSVAATMGIAAPMSHLIHA